MGIIKSIFGNAKLMQTYSKWKELGKYNSVFNSFGEDIYKSEIVRSCIRPLAEHSSKANVKCTDKEYIDKSIFFTCMLLYNLMEFTDIKQMFKDNICKNRFKDYIFKDCKEYILKKQCENSKSNHSDLTNQFLEIIHST